MVFSLCSEEPVVVAAEPVASIPGEPMDIMTALQLVLRKSLAYGGLGRGLHESAKVIEKNSAQLCVLAEDCDQPDYVKLVKALCGEHNVSLLTVPSAKTLGEWAGVSLIDSKLCYIFSFGVHRISHYCTDIHRLPCFFFCIELILVYLMQLCKIDSEGKARKVTGCSCVVVKVRTVLKWEWKWKCYINSVLPCFIFIIQLLAACRILGRSMKPTMLFCST